MKALLWKDVRLLINIIWLSLALMAMPYLLLVLVWAGGGSPAMLSETLNEAAGTSLALSVLSASFAGGSALSAERVDGSARFLNYLPPQRLAIACSKFIVTAVLLAGVWLANLGVRAATDPFVRPEANTLPDPGPGMLFALGAAVVMSFGVSWFFSSFMRTTGLPSFIAILIQILAVIVAPRVGIEINSPAGLKQLAAMGLITGVAGTAVGTAIFAWLEESP